MAKYEGWTIRTGFLAGNLFVDSGDDRGTYDEVESAVKYAQMCARELEREFPGAKVEINYELNAGGATPVTLETYVLTPEGEEIRPGSGSTLADRVDDVCGRVWESWEWVVYEDAR